jgi:hypothetical protein
MSAASSASSTAPPALHALWTAGPSPAGGQEPYRQSKCGWSISRLPWRVTKLQLACNRTLSRIV